MKLNICFGVLLIAVAAQQCEAASASQTSKTRDELIATIESINGVLKKVETKADDFLLASLQNITGLEGRLVENQGLGFVFLGLVGFHYLNIYIDHRRDSNITEEENKLISCMDDQSYQFMQTIENASIANAQCNTRLTGNLTVALQETTAALLTINAEIFTHTESWKSCSLGDDLCLVEFSAKIMGLIQTQLAGGTGTIRAALKNVIEVGKIILFSDIPRCANDVLMPQLAEGWSRESLAVRACFNS